MTHSEALADDRGAIIIITALLMVALLGMAAIVIDLGLMREQRRELVTATDAGALAAAGAYAVGEDGCTIAAKFVTATDPGATMDPGWCVHTASDSSGVVTVKASQTADFSFAPVLGIDEGRVDALTMAAYRPPGFVKGGLRPFALCIRAMERFPQWNLPLAASTGVLRVPYGKDDHPEACNGGKNSPGNWGLLDFDGGGNSTNDTRDWVRNGYDGVVNAGPPGRRCDEDPEVCVDGDPGAWSNSIGDELDHLITADAGKPLEFTLPIFDSGEGNGNNAAFHIIGFVRAKLHGYQATGPAWRRYLDLEFLPGLVEGGPGSRSHIDTGTRVVFMCGVEVGDNC